jgi:hypothetical protein
MSWRGRTSRTGLRRASAARDSPTTLRTDVGCEGGARRHTCARAECGESPSHHKVVERDHVE